ncbi:MAG: hypothetical protein HYV09_13300 [Deltaproteobacteria bacterium]|nr:hypothetical protein [Deltaproteobacteria bacterium]
MGKSSATILALVTSAALAPYGCEPRLRGGAPPGVPPTSSVAAGVAQSSASPSTALATTGEPSTIVSPTPVTPTVTTTPVSPSPISASIALTPQPPALLSFELPWLGTKRREVLRIEPRARTLSVTEAMMQKASLVSGPRLVFLNRHGGAFTPGASNASANKSSLLDKPTVIPPYEKGDASWKKVAACVRAQFTRWNVQLTEEDPGTGSHVEVVVGGHPSLLAMDARVGGVALMVSDCSVNDDSVAFVFSKTYGKSEQQAECETIAHELGHVLGLDHELHCPDPMTYLEGCGAKVFRDSAVACGESKVRPCACAPLQNSVAVLDKNVGLASASTPPVAMPPAPTTTAPPAPTTTAPPAPTGTPPKKGDGKGPNVSLLAPAAGSQLASGSQVLLLARVEDPDGVASVVLRWRMGAEVTQIDCAAPAAGVTCSSLFGTWAFRLPSGKGTRAWSIRATDKQGNQTVSEERELRLSDDGKTPAPPTGAPIPPAPTGTPSAPTLEATLVQPDAGKIYRWGETVAVRVTVNGVANAVQIVWRSAFGDEIQPLTKGEGDAWNGSFVVPKLSLPGPRALRAIVQGPAGATVETPGKTVTFVP